MRFNFKAKTKHTLAQRCGFRCSNPSCKRGTIGPADSKSKSVNIGVAAHITAASKKGPRFDSKMKPEDRTSITNGIWLCQNCAKLIDSDPSIYTKSLLIGWKRVAEKSARDAITKLESDGQPAPDELIGILKDRAKTIRSRLKKYYSNIDVKEYLDSFEELHLAHIKALGNGQWARAHEILKKIYDLSFHMEKTNFWAIDHQGVKYCLRDNAFTEGILASLYFIGKATRYSPFFPDDLKLVYASLVPNAFFDP